MSAVLRPQNYFHALTGADLEEVMPIEREVYEFPWSPGNFRDSMRAGYRCVAYRSEARELIGYGVLMMGPDEAHLLNLSIAAEFQRKGHGLHLLEHFIDISRQAAARTLFLEVRPSNLPARALYERRGFRQVGLRRAYYPANSGREDALILSLAI